jgi:hypothetical protein
MITMGFAFGISDVVTLDTPFSYNGNIVYSSYIYVYTAAGDIVYRNSAGELQYLPSAAIGYHPIAASEIVTSGDVNGVTRTTGATGLAYCGSVKY